MDLCQVCGNDSNCFCHLMLYCTFQVAQRYFITTTVLSPIIRPTMEIDLRSLFSFHINQELWRSSVSGFVFIFQNTLHVFIWIIFNFQSTQIKLIKNNWYKFTNSTINFSNYTHSIPQIEHWDSVNQQRFKIVSWIYFSTVDPCWFHNMPANRSTSSSEDFAYTKQITTYLMLEYALILNLFKR